MFFSNIFKRITRISLKSFAYQKMSHSDSENDDLVGALSDAVDNINDKIDETIDDTTVIEDRALWCDLLAFWILGLCNNYGFVVMLCAAHDIIGRFSNLNANNVNDLRLDDRNCTYMSTGVLLLADTLPSTAIKLTAPFLPFYIYPRMFFASLFSALGLIFVALSATEWQAILGIMFTSFSSGLGESSLLSYSPKYNKNVISTWASGTGAAGVAGAFTYAFLLEIGLSARTSLLLMLLVPFCQLLSFFCLLRKPQPNRTTVREPPLSRDHEESDSDEQQALLDPMQHTPSSEMPNIREKLGYFPKLFIYLIPLFLVYLAEYFINQGLYELIYFPGIWLNHDSQYRWLQVDYQIGVFFSRSSAIYLITPSIWIIFVLVFWEGLLGGCCYVNTFYRISHEVPERFKNFAMGIVGIGESFGVVFAGILAIPVHNIICKLPLPKSI